MPSSDLMRFKTQVSRITISSLLCSRGFFPGPQVFVPHHKTYPFTLAVLRDQTWAEYKRPGSYSGSRTALGQQSFDSSSDVPIQKFKSKFTSNNWTYCRNDLYRSYITVNILNNVFTCDKTQHSLKPLNTRYSSVMNKPIQPTRCPSSDFDMETQLSSVETYATLEMQSLSKRNMQNVMSEYVRLTNSTRVRDPQNVEHAEWTMLDKGEFVLPT